MAVLGVIISVVAGMFIYTGVERAAGGLMTLSWVTLIGIGLLIAAIGVALTTRVGGMSLKAVMVLAIILIILGLAGVGGAAVESNSTLDFTATETSWGVKFAPVLPFDREVEKATWNFGDGTTSTRISPTHWYAEDGVYEVSLEVVYRDTSRLAERTRSVEVDRSDASLALHTLEKKDGQVYLHLGAQDIVFTEISLWVSGLFCLVAGIYASHDQKRYRNRGIHESSFGYALRMLSLAWGVIALGLLFWLKAGGY
jgi:hypothetical protein